MVLSFKFFFNLFLISSLNVKNKSKEFFLYFNDFFIRIYMTKSMSLNYNNFYIRNKNFLHRKDNHLKPTLKKYI